jgi:hypothetical protein
MKERAARRERARSTAEQSNPLRGRRLRWASKNEVFSTGDKYTLPFKLRGLTAITWQIGDGIAYTIANFVLRYARDAASNNIATC